MRVALVCPYDLAVPGGVQSHVTDLAAALRAHGDEVVLVAPGSGGDVAVGPARGVAFNGSVAPIALGPGTWSRTRAAVRASGADVIHVHEPMVPIVGPAAVSARGGTPVVATFHAASSSHRVLRAARPLGKALLRHLDDLVAVSSAAARTHAVALGIARERFHVVGNGVDHRRFAHAPPTAGLTEGDGPVLLFVGRLEPRKGLAVMLAAFERLAGHRPDVRLLVVGEGPELGRLHGGLPAVVRERTRFLGRLEAAELPGVFAASDVFVSPALGGESFGIVLLEAMAAGCVVVASSIDGYRDVVSDGVDGVGVPVGDPDALAAAIEGILADPERAGRLRQAGQRTARRYDWDEVAAAIRARYLRVSGA